MKHLEWERVLCEFLRIPFEPLFAGYAAEIICFSFILDPKSRFFLVQDHAADRISRHYFTLYLYNQGIQISCLSIIINGSRAFQKINRSFRGRLIVHLC